MQSLQLQQVALFQVHSPITVWVIPPYGNNSSSLTKNFEKIQLSTSVAAHYGATAKQEKVYVNWQKANTVTGNKFGTIQEEFNG